MPRALITGVNGQDGSLLAELLLDSGYDVFGTVRTIEREQIDLLPMVHERMHLIEMDLGDDESVHRAISDSRPHEIYNLAAQSSVPISWQQPVLTCDITGNGVARLLDAIVRLVPDARFFQAGSSEMFGRSAEARQNESTPFQPVSPYGVAKLFAHHLVTCYRQRFGLFACNGILFNHESPRRGQHFVTRKITIGASRIALGLETELRLGSLDARRDWGSAYDFVRAYWLALQSDMPDDYVLGTGETHSVEEFVSTAFDYLGLDWRRHVIVDPQFVRPSDCIIPCADSSRARTKLRWRPEVSFEEMVKSMVDADIASLRAQLRTQSRLAA